MVGGMKAGFPFQHLVSELEAAMDPKAIVTFGDWERDASGGVERDVRVRGTRNGSPYDLFAECKDWST